MGFRINTNVGAMNAHMYALRNSKNLDTSLARLSSGLRINKAADDASGMAIADKLKAQANGLGQSVRNANDAIGLLQTGDGALQETTNILQRIRTLAVTAANDTQDTQSRSYIQEEIKRLESSLGFINDQTKFNGQLVFKRGSAFVFHIGAYKDEVTSTVISSVGASDLLGQNLLDVTTRSGAESAIAAVDAALKQVDGVRSTIGAAQNQLESVIRNISVTQVNVTAAESQIRDVDFAAESANFNKFNILAQSGSYAMSQANAVQQNVQRLLQ
ncbi:MAG: flagellin [Hydrogenimonas sp.]|nr:MAG: flagellin [Hydrogenimonas sp.]